MQMLNIEPPMIDDSSLLLTPKKKNTKVRKWREIEQLKAQQRLSRELKEIDQSFFYSLSDLV